jgi:glucosamine-6-phosphate deaminase
MRMVVCASAADAGRTAADHVVSLLNHTDRRVLGLATGSSPQPLYTALAGHVRRGLDLTDVRAFALDEYVGIPRDDPQSYHAAIDRDVVRPLQLDPALVRVPYGQAADAALEAAEYDVAITAAGGVEVQILGIGANGHIGFNEPGSPRSSRTRVVALTESTRRANGRFFAEFDSVPAHAITQGIASIMSARHIVLLASGITKAGAVRTATEGPVTADCPASFLQEHPQVALYLDLAGGPEALADAALRHLDAGQQRIAGRLAEMATLAAPDSEHARSA